MKWFVVFFLLIPFFLPFPVEGSLDISDEYCSGSNEIVTFTVRIEDASTSVYQFGFDVIFDYDILAYRYSDKGTLANSIRVTQQSANRLRIQGHGNSIEEGDSGELVLLTFELIECEESTLKIDNLMYDFNYWDSYNGNLKVRRASGGSGYYPYLPPMLPLTVPGFIPPPGLGYLGFTPPLPQLYPPAFLPISGYEYYHSPFQGIPYQSLPYPSWQPSLYQQTSYNQPFSPYWGSY